MQLTNLPLVLDTTAAFGLAWLVAVVALAVHVADEATHDFLSWYNPRALRIRRLLWGGPFPPTFTLLPWLLLLVVAIVALAALTPAAFAGKHWLRLAACVLAAEHVANGLNHIVWSLISMRPVPGVLSAPLLLLSGAWLGSVAMHLP